MSSKSYHSKEMIARALSIRDIKQAENEWGVNTGAEVRYVGD